MSLRVRRSARIVLVDETGRVLLFRYAMAGFPTFWCGPGGECEPGEDFAAAAVRELFEETGLKVASCRPEIDRTSAEFVVLSGERVVTDERLFFLRTAPFEVDLSGVTEIERAAGMTHRWFAVEELAEWPETIYPKHLAELIDRFC